MTSDDLLKIVALRSRSSFGAAPPPPAAARRCASDEVSLPGAYFASPSLATPRRRNRRSFTKGGASADRSGSSLQLDRRPQIGNLDDGEEEVTPGNAAITASLVEDDEETEVESCRRLQDIESQMQHLTSQLNGHFSSTCSSVMSDMSLSSIFSFDGEEDDEEDEYVLPMDLPEARPVLSFDTEMLVERMAQLEQEMKRIQQELLMQQQEQSQAIMAHSSSTSSFSSKDVDTTQIIQAFREHVKVKNRMYRFKTYKNCFVESQAVDVLVQLTGKSRRDALLLGINLGVDLLEHVCDKKRHPVLEDNYIFYRFL